MSKGRTPIADLEVRAEVARNLTAFFADGKNKKATIASLLNISRQNLYNYISGKRTPSSEILAKICGLPGVCLRVAGKEISATDLARAGKPSESESQQISLPFDQAVVLMSGDQNVSVEVTRKPAGTATTVEFRISINAVPGS